MKAFENVKLIDPEMLRRAAVSVPVAMAASGLSHGNLLKDSLLALGGCLVKGAAAKGLSKMGVFGAGELPSSVPARAVIDRESQIRFEKDDIKDIVNFLLEGIKLEQEEVEIFTEKLWKNLCAQELNEKTVKEVVDRTFKDEVLLSLDSKKKDELNNKAKEEMIKKLTIKTSKLAAGQQPAAPPSLPQTPSRKKGREGNDEENQVSVAIEWSLDAKRKAEAEQNAIRMVYQASIVDDHSDPTVAIPPAGQKEEGDEEWERWLDTESLTAWGELPALASGIQEAMSEERIESLPVLGIAASVPVERGQAPIVPAFEPTPGARPLQSEGQQQPSSQQQPRQQSFLPAFGRATTPSAVPPTPVPASQIGATGRKRKGSF